MRIFFAVFVTMQKHLLLFLSINATRRKEQSNWTKKHLLVNPTLKCQIYHNLIPNQIQRGGWESQMGQNSYGNSNPNPTPSNPNPNPKPT